MGRHLFLRWALLNTFSVMLFLVLGIGFVGRVEGAPLLVAAATVVLAAATSAYCGRLCWLAGSPRMRRLSDRELIHRAEHVYFAVGLCQLMGLLGAAVGFYLIATSSSSDDATHAVGNIIDGLGTGLVATITGVLCSVVLAVEHHALVHHLES